MGRLGGQRVAGAATAPLSTAPATATPAPATVDTPPATPRRRVPLWVTRMLAAAVALGMALVAAIGFASSYETLRTAAVDKGFGPTLAYWIPIGIDGAILAFIALDLVLLSRRISWPVLRIAAHGMTLATVFLNAASSGRPIAADPVAAVWHGIMPCLFIVGVEAARRLVVHAAQLEAGTVTDRIPLHRWALSPIRTGRLYRRMRLANVRSYVEMVEREQALDGYRVWLTQQKGGDLSKASEIERLPMTMAPRGYTVEEALALPEKWAAEQAERERQQAERKRREAERAAEDDKRARLQAIRDRGEIQQVELQTDAETSAAQSAAEAARIRAEHTKLQAERTAQAESEALQSEEAATARRRAEENNRIAQEERRKAEEESRKAAKLEADRKAEEARKTAAARQIAENEERTAEATRRMQEHREAAAAAEAAALEAEDLIRLSPRERKARRVARMILMAGAVDAVSLQQIQEELGGSQTTAGELRQEAVDLLNGGYGRPDGGQRA
ncbi:DUF2637 domain-containing protein [Streptomyces sp. NPDC050355]|uniref:DUF2637 domain-containing protein n=1 Tax=Streptomyces sp. NPDC050355 TaxID=3365609 RepID=UPI00378D6627